MTTRALSIWSTLAFGAVLVFLPILSGCQTGPKVDWKSRVGNYTFDQAVAEMGPPDKSSKLTDGTLIAEWLVAHPSGGFSFGVGTGSYSRSSGVGVGVGTSTSPGARWRRLTFGPDGKLTAQSEYRR